MVLFEGDVGGGDSFFKKYRMLKCLNKPLLSFWYATSKSSELVATSCLLIDKIDDKILNIFFGWTTFCNIFSLFSIPFFLEKRVKYRKDNNNGVQKLKDCSSSCFDLQQYQDSCF